VWKSSSFPMPSRIGHALLVDSNSSHSSDAASRSRSLLLRAVQLPIQKSKSLTVDPVTTVSLICASFPLAPPVGRYTGNRATFALYLCFPRVVQTPTARLLELLELLQERPLTTGREIADRLEIDARTVRRYIEALQGLGIPVEGQRGVGGGYRVRPGLRLAP